MTQNRRWNLCGCDLYYGGEYVVCLHVGNTGVVVGRRIIAHSRRVHPELWAWYELVYDDDGETAASEPV